MTPALRIALVGYGRIARSEHHPTIEASDAFRLVAVVDPRVVEGDVPCYADIDALLASNVAVDAVSMCQPPVGRFDAARTALEAGLHVLLEKPPGATVGEVDALVSIARRTNRTLYTAWHSRFAPAVASAREWLSTRRVRSLTVTWCEHVQDWHPGQQWIWEPGGFGVFDPGINALSIITELVGPELRVTASRLLLPLDAQTPIAAELGLETGDGVVVQGSFDWRRSGAPEWRIHVVTDGGELELLDGGARLLCDGRQRVVDPSREYDGVYARFASLIRARACEVDATPLRLVADALLLGSTQRVEAADYTRRVAT